MPRRETSAPPMEIGQAGQRERYIGTHPTRISAPMPKAAQGSSIRQSCFSIRRRNPRRQGAAHDGVWPKAAACLARIAAYTVFAQEGAPPMPETGTHFGLCVPMEAAAISKFRPLRRPQDSLSCQARKSGMLRNRGAEAADLCAVPRGAGARIHTRQLAPYAFGSLTNDPERQL
jgi:hypothetical protein